MELIKSESLVAIIFKNLRLIMRTAGNLQCQGWMAVALVLSVGWGVWFRADP